MQTARTDDAPALFPRCCRKCKTLVFGNRIGKAPACEPCRTAELAATKATRAERARHERDEMVYAAHAAVKTATRQGALPFASDVACEQANTGHCSGPHAWHHDDYAKPLDVRCLCSWHHSWWHSMNNAKRGTLVKCGRPGCRAEAETANSRWRCDAHSTEPGLPEWQGCRGGWRVWGDHGSGLVSKCRNGFNVKLNRQGVTVVRVHTPEELREEMRRVFTLATGLAA